MQDELHPLVVNEVTATPDDNLLLLLFFFLTFIIFKATAWRQSELSSSSPVGA